MQIDEKSVNDLKRLVLVGDQLKKLTKFHFYGIDSVNNF